MYGTGGLVGEDPPSFLTELSSSFIGLIALRGLRNVRSQARGLFVQGSTNFV